MYASPSLFVSECVRVCIVLSLCLSLGDRGRGSAFDTCLLVFWWVCRSPAGAWHTVYVCRCAIYMMSAWHAVYIQTCRLFYTSADSLRFTWYIIIYRLVYGGYVSCVRMRCGYPHRKWSCIFASVQSDFRFMIASRCSIRDFRFSIFDWRFSTLDSWFSICDFMIFDLCFSMHETVFWRGQQRSRSRKCVAYLCTGDMERCLVFIPSCRVHRVPLIFFVTCVSHHSRGVT